VKKTRNSGLFKVDVPQAVEEIALFNHPKKCFLCSGDFQRRSYIFCAAVNLLKSQALIKKSYRQKKSIAKQRRQNGTLGRLK
jgi:hypothetical protein